MFVFATAVADLAESFGCLLVADFISGCMHWAEDTWTAPGRSAFLDRWIVLDNIEHHRRPGSIRGGSYWVTNRAGIAGAIALGACCALAGIHAWQVYVILVLASQANHVHMWAHSSKRPRAVRVLQACGLLQSREHHGAHHTRPYASRFCAYTNYLNPILDGIGFWRALERLGERCGATVVRCSAARGGY